MIIVSDYYQETMSDQYIDLDQYKKLEKNQEFVEIEALRRDMYDDNVSFEDYLKHFVFIEATDLSTKYDNTKKYFDKRTGILFSSGNDKVVQENFRNNYTVISLSNLNKGIKMYNKEIQNSFLEYVKSLAFENKRYDWFHYGNQDKQIEYCSGIVYFGYKNNNLKILNEQVKSYTISTGYWYMPRSVTNSPFMYTRIWYRK